jgi:hypothetical protein
MRASQIKEVIRESIKDSTNFPALFIWGGPGIGKSSVVKQVAREGDVECLDIRLLLLDPTDLRGIPVPEDGRAKWLAPNFLPKEGKGILFFDELNTAPVLVQNSALQLVLDRRLGEYVLPSGWCVISAGNREMEAFVHRMSPPLLNRFIHIDFDVDIDEWVAWAIKNDIAPEIVAFLVKFRPELLYKFEKEKKSFPTPRAWEFCSRVIKNEFSQDLKYDLIKGAVGEGAAHELEAYMHIWTKLPDLGRILKGDNIIPTDLDVMYATCVGLVARAEKQDHYTRLLDYSLELKREFTTFLVKMLMEKDQKKVVSSPNWSKLSNVIVVEERLLI